MVVAWSVVASGCGQVRAPDAPEATDSSADDVSDTSAALDAGSLDAPTGSSAARDERCPARPPAVGPSTTCIAGVICNYYERCFEGGSAEGYLCKSAPGAPRQWIRIDPDCSGAFGSDGCALSLPLIYTLCPKLGAVCKYKGCAKYVCKPEDGAGVWTPDGSDCDVGPG